VTCIEGDIWIGAAGALIGWALGCIVSLGLVRRGTR
jgi:hypothetical protein